jgi:CRISPR system Cascade subunit CasC
MGSRFIQLHTLTSYAASLLNRDDVGFAKRIPFGGAERVRVSSQCLKRHWRRTTLDLAWARIEHDGGEVPMAVRSRRTFEKRVFEPLVSEGVSREIAAAVVEEMIETLLPKGKAKASKGEAQEEGGESLRTSQVIVLGQPETRYLLGLARTAVAEADVPEAARKAWKALDRGELKKNLQELVLGAGLDAALFGRMVTGDILSRCDAAIHVAHAFTVDAGSFETDYFSAVDDLQEEGETGSGHINNSELTTGLFYGYTVVDVPLLISNVGGDRDLAAEAVRRLVHIVSTVSPGAKLGATAPYARALCVLAEAGASQPRTLANAFLEPVKTRDGLLETAQTRLATHLNALDEMYGRETERRVASIALPEGLALAAGERSDLPGLAVWVAEAVKGAA